MGFRAIVRIVDHLPQSSCEDGHGRSRGAKSALQPAVARRKAAFAESSRG